MPRSSVCDGFKLKPPPEKKKAPKKSVPKKAAPTATPGIGATPPKTAIDPLPMPNEQEGTAAPVAFGIEELQDAAPELLADGPGPDNGGASEGSLPPVEERPEEDSAPAEDAMAQATPESELGVV